MHFDYNAARESRETHSYNAESIRVLSLTPSLSNTNISWIDANNNPHSLDAIYLTPSSNEVTSMGSYWLTMAGAANKTVNLVYTNFDSAACHTLVLWGDFASNSAGSARLLYDY